MVDTCGYVPADVARAADLLAGSCGHYAFVSSINAYPAWPEHLDYTERGAHDSDPDATRDDLPADLDPSAAYGWLKVGCERAVERAFGGERTTVLRAGLIVGPHDSAVGRLPWWLDRVARGGEVLVPGSPDAPISMIDARDLARFALLAAPGTFQAPGPSGRDTRADLMAAAKAATGSDATFTYVTDERWLGEQGVQYWTEVPLWIPTDEGPATFRCEASAAEAAGLRWRPMAETVADTWAWQSASRAAGSRLRALPGLAADREKELLFAWAARS